MNKDEIEKIVLKVCCSDSEEYDIPDEKDWLELEKKLGIKYKKEYKTFVNFLGKYEIPLMFLNVIEAENSNGDDTVVLAYNFEKENNKFWPQDLIPFVDIGNGDYFCFSRNDSKVHYYYHDKLKSEIFSDDFDSWLISLPEFLSD